MGQLRALSPDEHFRPRLVLNQFAMTESYRFWSVDVLDQSKNPLVYYIDHEGPPIGDGKRKLSPVLATLKKAPNGR